MLPTNTANCLGYKLPSKQNCQRSITKFAFARGKTWSIFNLSGCDFSADYARASLSGPLHQLPPKPCLFRFEFRHRHGVHRRDDVTKRRVLEKFEQARNSLRTRAVSPILKTRI